MPRMVRTQLIWLQCGRPAFGFLKATGPALSRHAAKAAQHAVCLDDLQRKIGIEATKVVGIARDDP
ncbi:MAG TPA: hypothetical protein VMG80_00555, partial [Solirubrobacteraceae bacterium]|nr:hypothetical protein [Solirubrobacteraceae bacterium]